MENLILAVHLVTALAIIVLVLLQQGKGAEAGASFGAGASQTIFGSGGSWNFFSKLTAILATLFFVTSITLALIAKDRSGISAEDDWPELEQSRPQREQRDEIPAGEQQAPASEIPAFGDGQ